MTTHELSSYSREILSDTLRVMRNYKNSIRQVGRRAVIHDPRIVTEAVPSVEYAPGIDMDLLQKYAATACKKYFPEYSGTQDAIAFRENPKLVSGIRIHYGDDLVDVSFQKFTNLFHH